MPHSRSVALITGASSGIGAVYADRWARRGHDLILVARREDRLRALAHKLSKEQGVEVEIVVADLQAESDLARLEQRVGGEPRLAVLVNNAGLARLGPFAQSRPEDSRAQIDLNITALTRLTRAALPAFTARRRGLIVNIASVLAVQTLPVSAVYSGTKAYVLAFSRGLQQELKDTGVKVQVVLPAATATEIWDSSGVALSAIDRSTVMSAEDLVDAALAGLDQGEAITVPPLADAGLWSRFEEARTTVFAATRTGKPAPRYAAA